MKILIKVTKEILERSKMCGVSGYRNVVRDCAVAEASREIFPTAGVCVDSNDDTGYVIAPFLCAGIDKDIISIQLPKSASRFIREFDCATPERRAAMEPVSFEIDVPSEVIDKIGISEVYRILSESKTLELVHP